MRRKQMVRAQGSIANDVMWRRGYLLPDGLPPASVDLVGCEHWAFGARVEVNRIT